MQVATPPTASEFRGGITGITLRPVSGADIVSLITDEHLLHGMEEQTERMRLEIMRESHAELEDVCFTLYGEGQDSKYRGFQAPPPSPGSGLLHPGLALAMPPPKLLPVLAEVDDT